MSFTVRFPYGLMSLSFGLFISVYNTRACAGLVNAPHNNHCLVAYFLFGRVKVMSYCLDLSESDDYFIVTLGCILGKPWKTFGVFFPFCLFFFFWNCSNMSITKYCPISKGPSFFCVAVLVFLALPQLSRELWGAPTLAFLPCQEKEGGC